MRSMGISKKLFEIFLSATKLGLTSFGGPVAHLSYFREEYVVKKKWINESAYADIVALCQFLPGPASSQVGMAIGLSRGGVLGAIVNWIGFTFPSALILTLFGLGITSIENLRNEQLLHSLKVVAVAVVAQAVLGMGTKLCPDRNRITIALLSSVILLMTNSPYLQIIILFLAGIYGIFFLKSSTELPHEPIHKGNTIFGLLCLLLFFSLLIILPILRANSINQSLHLFDSFFRVGSLVFGGGHVVLPLLQNEVVPAGWVTNDLFMAGYGLSNAIPGPLFAFSSYLGAVSNIYPNGFLGSLICLVAIFLPSFLLVVGILPFWEKLRKIVKIRQALLGINAAVVGFLLCALYHPVFTTSIFSSKDFALVCVYFVLLEYWKTPSWAVVILAITFGFIFY